MVQHQSLQPQVVPSQRHVRTPTRVTFLLNVGLLLAALVLSLGTAFHWLDIRFRVGPYFVTHWLSWIGTLFIGGYTPLYYAMKRRRPRLLKYLLPTHMFGNLISFAFISMHFTQQLTRPTEFYPDLGTGVVLYLVMVLLVVSGILHRYQLLRRRGAPQQIVEGTPLKPSRIPHQNRFLHVSLTLTFYAVIGIHILQGVGVL